MSIEWRNSNEGSNFPFNELSTMTNGTLVIPDNLFIDARFYPIGNAPELFLSSVDKTDTDIVFNLSTDSVSNIASGTYNIIATVDNIRFVDQAGREAGVAITSSTRIVPLLGWPIGNHAFDKEHAQFSPLIVTPIPDFGVTSIRSGNDTEVLTDDVYLIGGDGVTLKVDMAAENGPTIIVNFDGEPLFKQLLCTPDEYSVPCFLKTINGQPPDEFGNFYIGSCGIDNDNSIIRITPTSTGLRIHVVTRGRSS